MGGWLKDGRTMISISRYHGEKEVAFAVVHILAEKTSIDKHLLLDLVGVGFGKSGIRY